MLARVAFALALALVPAIAFADGAGATFPGANGRIAFQSSRDGTTEIYVMNPDGSNQTRLTDNAPYADTEPEFSPDDRWITFTSNRDGGGPEVYVMGIDGRPDYRRTANSALESGPTFSANSTFIAFASDRDGDFEVFSMPIFGTPALEDPETENSAGDIAPTYSPDGVHLAFVSDRDSTPTVLNEEIYVMGVNGDNETNITNNPADDSYPSYSPDGTKIAFASNRDGTGAVWVMGADGSNPTRLTSNFESNGRPAWSPDGSMIAFEKTLPFSSNIEIYVMRADGTGQTRLTFNAAADLSPSWESLPQAAGPGPGPGPGPGTQIPVDLEPPSGFAIASGKLTLNAKNRLKLVFKGPANETEPSNAVVDLRTAKRLAVTAAAAKPRKRVVKLARKRFTLAPGVRKTVTIKLSRKRARLVRKLGRVRVAVRLSLTDQAGNTRKATKKVTLRTKKAQ